MTAPRLQSIAPSFLVDDVGFTARWYREHLGFSIDAFPEREPWVFAILILDGVEIMLQRLAGHVHQSDVKRREPPGWDAYIRMAGVRALHAKLGPKGLVTTPLTERAYADTEFEVTDPNGYILVFSEREKPSRPD